MHSSAIARIARRATPLLLVVALAVGCSPAPGASTSASVPASPSASASPSGSASGSASASASPSASPTASASAAAAACIDSATRDLFYENLNDLADLSVDQQAQIIAAIEAYDFSAVPNGAAWQQAVVTAFKAGDWKPLELAGLVSGAIDLARCP